MAPSIASKALGRDANVKAAITHALAEGDHFKALDEAVRALRGEAAKLRKRRPHDAALSDAELAGYLAAIAAALHARKPPRPEGCPAIPRPDDLAAVFHASYAAASQGGAT